MRLMRMYLHSFLSIHIIEIVASELEAVNFRAFFLLFSWMKKKVYPNGSGGNR